MDGRNKVRATLDIHVMLNAREVEAEGGTMTGDIGVVLDDWAGYYTLMGGAAATLLGLLFVSLSLRLNIFRQENVADVRDFAALTFGTFLTAIAIAGLILAPHEHRAPLVLALVLGSVVGFTGLVWMSREWLRLNQIPQPDQPGGQLVYAAYVIVIFLGLVYLAMLASALLIWQRSDSAMGVLAITEAGLIGMGTLGAWLLLSHAGPPDEPGERT